MRDQMFRALPTDWLEPTRPGCFTEFMEQRAPGHTVADGKIYRKGMLDFKQRYRRRHGAAGFPRATREALDKREELLAMDISCDACILFAAAHAGWPGSWRGSATTRSARPNWRRSPQSARTCRREPPRDFREALQAYWFCHLAVITELNGWDSFSPGQLDQHLLPVLPAGTGGRHA